MYLALQIVGDRRVKYGHVDSRLARIGVDDKAEFLELIPSYLRQGIAPTEGNWLSDVQRIIRMIRSGKPRFPR
jgi:hypothetical protein